MVMLADMDAGSIITLVQSGAQWGYRLLLLQFLLAPLMYMAQELTIRLGLCKGKGYGELIREGYGRRASLFVTVILLLSCFAALVTEFSGLVGVGELLGVKPPYTLTLLVVAILAMILSSSYQAVERVVIFFGLFSLAFFVMVYEAHPDFHQLSREILEIPWDSSSYYYLIAANIGTSIMPWTIFYQQSALIDKRLSRTQLTLARVDTMAGAILCQLLSSAALVASAAVLGAHYQERGLDDVSQIGDAFGRLAGPLWGKLVFAIGLSGGALVAAVVVCLTAAWAIGEAMGVRHSLEQHPLDAPWFYGPFALLLVAAALLVGSGINLIRLSIAAAVVNSLLLPVVLWFLYRLSVTVLPAEHRLRGAYGRLVGLSFVTVSVLGVYSAIAGLLA